MDIIVRMSLEPTVLLVSFVGRLGQYTVYIVAQKSLLLDQSTHGSRLLSVTTGNSMPHPVAIIISLENSHCHHISHKIEYIVYN
jgi:hypothetical protein